MTTTRKQLKEIIKNNSFKWIAVRGTNQPLEIGETLGTSYEWDYERDVSSYDTEPVELGGVCAVDLTHDNQWNDWIETEEEMTEVLDYMESEIQRAKEIYKMPYNYIITSVTKNPLDFDENDDNEIILADAVVVAQI